MRSTIIIVAAGLLLTIGLGPGGAISGQQSAETDDPVRTLVGRLQLEQYKATLKG